MKEFFTFITLLFFSRIALPCGTDAQHKEMAETLFSDSGMQKFVCASDFCTMHEFKEGLQFHEYGESYHWETISVCLVEPVLSATNSYTGIFVSKNGEFKSQFISYGSGVEVSTSKTGIPTITEYSVSDTDNQHYS
jgi:hypothetical protein